MDSVDQELTDNGYVTAGDYHKQKQEGDLIYHVLLKESEDDVWGVFYCYPSDSEEGWGRELPVIADTFALSAGARDEREVLTEGDCQEIRNVMDEFAAAYFGGDRDSVRRFLADTYEGEVDLYQGSGVISDLKQIQRSCCVSGRGCKKFCVYGNLSSLIRIRYVNLGCRFLEFLVVDCSFYL